MLKINIKQVFLAALVTQSLAGWAASPPITVAFDSASSTITFTAGETGSANYVVTGPTVPGTLNLTVHAGATGNLTATQIQNGGTSLCIGGQAVCAASPFALVNGQSCCLQFSLSSTTAGSYSLAPSVATNPPTYTGHANGINVTVNPLPPTTTITVPANFTIAYATAGAQTATGTLTVTNTGQVDAKYVKVTNFDNLTCNNGTVSQTPCTAQPNSTCDISFSVTAPTTCLPSGGITVSGGNTNIATTAAAFSIAGYYVFALSNTDSSTDPQVVDNSNINNSEQWGNNVVTNAQSLTNGYANTGRIYTTTGIGTSAAVNCYNSMNGGATAGTWYLPAICQMGGSGQNAGCSNADNTTIDELVQLGFITDLAGNDWSSTEFSDYPQYFAWLEGFATGGDSYQSFGSKNYQFGVRCVRALTP